MNWKLLFWLTALTLLLSVASLWFEPSNDFALPSDFTHQRIAAAFVRNAAEIRSIYGWGEDWRGEFASQLRADKLILSSLLFSCLANCASIRALMFIAALAGFAQNYGLWEATVNPGYPANDSPALGGNIAGLRHTFRLEDACLRSQLLSRREQET